MRWRAVVLASVVLAGGGMGAAAVATDSPPPASGCVQAAGTSLGGPFVFTGVVNATAGGACRYTARVAGGYRAAGDDWRVVVEKVDGRTRVFSSGLGSSPCWEDVIDPGDAVEAWSSVAVAAGPDITC